METTSQIPTQPVPQPVPPISVDADPARRLADLEKALEERNRRVAELAAMLLRMEVKLAFYGSKFLRERTLLSPELAFKAYGERFIVQEAPERRVVALAGGSPMQSQTRPGQYADVDEALALFMENDPDMAQLLRATPGGAGSAGALPGGPNGLRVIAATDAAAFSRNLDDIAAGRVLVR